MFTNVRILKENIDFFMFENSIASARIFFQEFMRGHDAYRGNKAFQRPSRNAAVVRQLVVVWDERTSVISFLR